MPPLPSSTKRFLSAISVLIIGLLIAPFALDKVVLERNPLPSIHHVKNIVTSLCDKVEIFNENNPCTNNNLKQELVSKNLYQIGGFPIIISNTNDCTIENVLKQLSHQCKKSLLLQTSTSQLDAPHGHYFSLKLLLNHPLQYHYKSDLNQLLSLWNTNIVQPFQYQLQHQANRIQPKQTSKLESHVVLMTELKDVDMVTKSLFRSLSEFDVPVNSYIDSPTQRKLVNLIVLLTSSDKPIKSARVPGWGIVIQIPSFTSPSLDIALNSLLKYTKHIVLGMPHHQIKSDDNMENETSSNVVVTAQTRYKIMSQRFTRTVEILRMTNELAESMTHMRVPTTVSKPFEEIVSLLMYGGNTSNSLLDRLDAVSEAGYLAEIIAEDPDLVPQMYISGENLFAVFSPFILPVIIPLIASLVTEGKRMVLRNRKP
jgi:hypothetical protein